MEKNTLALIVALVLIIAAIAYVESTKPAIAQNPAQSLAQQAGSVQVQGGQPPYPPAPEFSGVSGYINAPANLTMASLRGKVVLVDFWTYSCINCIRTLPYLESWYEKYSGEGLVIVGVHSPEFDFEKNYANVQAAVARFNITYPVVMDNDHAIWNSYQNEYWPRDYLIDAKGGVRFDHIGEGGYDETESQIVQLLSEAKNSTVPMNSTPPAGVVQPDFGQVNTPEIYLGAARRSEPLGNANPLYAGEQFSASIPAGALAPNVPYLEGNWTNGADAVELSGEKGAVELDFSAKNVNIVAGSPSGTNLTIFIDGNRAAMQDCAGAPDSPSGSCPVSGERLYSILTLPQYGQHVLRIDAEGSGFELFTFTFG